MPSNKRPRPNSDSLPEKFSKARQMELRQELDEEEDDIEFRQFNTAPSSPMYQDNAMDSTPAAQPVVVICTLLQKVLYGLSLQTIIYVDN